MFIGPISTLAGCTDFSLYATNVSLAMRAEADISGDYGMPEVADAAFISRTRRRVDRTRTTQFITARGSGRGGRDSALLR